MEQRKCGQHLQNNGEEEEEGGDTDTIAALWKCSAVITSTLKDCSSAFTAHKIHSNNWQPSVHAQQLWRHLLPRSANTTIVDHRFFSPSFQVGRDADKSYAFGGTIVSGCLLRRRETRGDGAAASTARAAAEEREAVVFILLLVVVVAFPGDRLVANACQQPAAGPRVRPPEHRSLFRAEASSSSSSRRGIAPRFLSPFPPTAHAPPGSTAPPTRPAPDPNAPTQKQLRAVLIQTDTVSCNIDQQNKPESISQLVLKNIISPCPVVLMNGMISAYSRGLFCSLQRALPCSAGRGR